MPKWHESGTKGMISVLLPTETVCSAVIKTQLCLQSRQCKDSLEQPTFLFWSSSDARMAWKQAVWVLFWCPNGMKKGCLGPLAMPKWHESKPRGMISVQRCCPPKQSVSKAVIKTVGGRPCAQNSFVAVNVTNCIFAWQKKIEHLEQTFWVWEEPLDKDTFVAVNVTNCFFANHETARPHRASTTDNQQTA